MQFSSSRIYKGYEINYGAREVAPGLFEPVADTRPMALEESAASRTEVGFDRRWLMNLNEALSQAQARVLAWVDAQT